ncbi:MAG: lysophospholipid acyltransferase family protein [Promethearchaeota archaeon]
MAQNSPVIEDKEGEKPKLNKKELMGDLFYNAVKGVGGVALKAFADLKVEGIENIPIIGKAILTTISKNVFRDMLLISQLSGRKIHFMLHPKIMKHQIAGPVLKTLGMIRGTESKEDTEPIENVFEILNQKGNLVAMTPEARYDREIQVKSMAAIIKFAIAGKASIIPLGVYTEKSKLFNLIPISGLRIKVGTPLKVNKRLNREKYRSQRYELAEDIINIIDNLRQSPEI